MKQTFLSKVMPQDYLGFIISVLGGVVGVLFPAPPHIYQGIFFLVFLDTITGWLAAKKKGTVNSKTFRRKLFPKIIQYLLTILLVYTAKNILQDTHSEVFADMILGFTLASIVYAEVTSIIENYKAYTGNKVRLFFDVQDVTDFIEANHLEDGNADRSVRKGYVSNGQSDEGTTGT